MGGVRAQFSTDVNVRMSLFSIPFFNAFEATMGHPSGYRPQGYLFVATTAQHLDYLGANHRHLAAVIRAQIIEMLGGGRDEQVSLRAVSGRMSHRRFKRVEERNREQRHPDIHIGRKLGAYAAHALSGGSLALMRLALQHNHVAAAAAGQLVRDAGSDDAAAYDDYFRG